MKLNNLKKFQRALLASGVALGLSATASLSDIRFWTTEEQPARLAKQEAMAAAFEAKTGIAVEIYFLIETE